MKTKWIDDFDLDVKMAPYYVNDMINSFEYVFVFFVFLSFILNKYTFRPIVNKSIFVWKDVVHKIKWERAMQEKKEENVQVK